MESNKERGKQLGYLVYFVEEKHKEKKKNNLEFLSPLLFFILPNIDGSGIEALETGEKTDLTWHVLEQQKSRV